MPQQDHLGRKCGYLHVEKETNSGQFVRRYFILNAKKTKLRGYIEDPQNPALRDLPPLHVFNLRYVSMVSEVHNRPKLQHCLCITESGVPHYVLANDEADCRGWVGVLTDATKIVVPNVDAQFPHEPVKHAVSYKSEVVAGVIVKTPFDNTTEGNEVAGCDWMKQIHQAAARISPVFSRQQSSEEESPDGVSCFGAGGTNAGSNFFVTCSSDSDYDSSCDERPGPSRRRVSGQSSVCAGSPIKTGYCVKQGGRIQTWRRRFFVLDEVGLSYYRTESESTPLRCIKSVDIVEARPSIGIHRDREHMFEVVTEERVFYIQPDSFHERDAWINAINFTRQSSQRRKDVSKSIVYPPPCSERSQSFRRSARRHMSAPISEETVNWLQLKLRDLKPP